MRLVIKCLALAALISGPLYAGEKAVASRVYLERSNGQQRSIEGAQDLRRGDRVVALVDWNSAPANSTMTSAVPAHLSFLDSSMDTLEVSLDGGRSWMPLEMSRGGRVTHLRWRPAQGGGRLAYSAIVR